MATGRGQWGWALVMGFLALAIIAGGALLLTRPGRGQLEITLATPTPPLGEQGEVYVGGAVALPGLYTLDEADGVGDILRRAGGPTQDADISRLKLYVPRQGELSEPQRVNLNTAPAWLLEALPGIGPKLAQAIIDYRREKGYFRSIEELTRVEGIGPETFRKLKDLITVAD